MSKIKSERQVNSRYTVPLNRSIKSYRKFVRSRMFPKGLEKFFS